MKKTILILAIAIVMIGCIGCDRQKEKTAPNRFPGFTQIGSTGEWSKLYLDLNSAQKEGLIVTFKFIRVVESGYVIQEGATDCRKNFLRRDGVQYKDDGTSDRKNPGDAAPMPYQNQPGIPELVRVACNKTGLPPAPSAEQPAQAPVLVPTEPAEQVEASTPRQVSSEDTVRQTQIIINDFLATANHRNVEALLSFYGDEVDYFNVGIVNKNFIRKDKTAYFTRWTTVNNAIVGQPQIYAQENDIISVKFSTNWKVQNNRKTISGMADNTWKLRKTEGGLKIVDEKQKVTSRF